MGGEGQLNICHHLVQRNQKGKSHQHQYYHLAQVSEVEQADFLVTHIMDKWVTNRLVILVIMKKSMMIRLLCYWDSTPYFSLHFSERLVWAWRTRWGHQKFSVEVQFKDTQLHTVPSHAKKSHSICGTLMLPHSHEILYICTSKVLSLVWIWG